MTKIVKGTFLFAACALCVADCYAQWTPKDSLKLKTILENPEEPELNKGVVKSIDLGGLDLLPEQPEVYKDYLHFDETLPDWLPSLDERPQQRVGLTLKPYNGSTKYNYDPVYKRRILLEGDLTKPGEYKITRPAMKGMGKMMDGTRIMMMGGNLGGSFKYNLDRLFHKEFWNFRARKSARKTLLALAAYSNGERNQGRYEYYHLDGADFSVKFAGSQQAEEKINLKLQEYETLKVGLLYFKYTSESKGDFTIYLPDEQYMRGTFTHDWKGYKLLYQGVELFVSLSQIEGTYYKLNLNLTKEFRILYPLEQIEKVALVATASKISSGRDRY